MKYLATLALIASCSPAYAQQNCASTDEVYTTLLQKYQEERVAVGINTNGNLVEFWGNEESGSWSVIITSPDGVSCLADSGVAFTREQLRGQL